MKLGICTGGGDCPGLNAVIRAVVKSAIGKYKMDVVGIENSLHGLMKRPLAYRKLHFSDVTHIIDRGGTILGTTSRMKLFSGVEDERIALAEEGFSQLGLDGLLVVGGEGTQALAKALSLRGVPVIGIPKTIDNDLPGSDQTIGFSTAVQVATEAVQRLQSTAESHDRVMILEVMGRDSGYIALHAGVAGGANVVLLPEIPFDIESVRQKILVRKKLGRYFTVIVAAEGARPATTSSDLAATPHIGTYLANHLGQIDGFESRVTVLGHVQRGGQPSPEDRFMATVLGAEAVQLAASKQFGNLITWRGGEPSITPYASLDAGRRKQISKSYPALKAAEAIGICLGRPLDFEVA